MVSVSIIICNYNYEKYIGDALESVLHQTIPDWECIVIDDGSTDNSVDIIKSYVERDSRFRLIQTEHGGTSRARNAGLDVATGEYIAFLDSDDCYTEYALEMLLHLARTTNADMAGGMANMVPAEYKYVPAPSRQTWTAGMNISRRNPSAFLLADIAAISLSLSFSRYSSDFKRVAGLYWGHAFSHGLYHIWRRFNIHVGFVLSCELCRRI